MQQATIDVLKASLQRLQFSLEYQLQEQKALEESFIDMRNRLHQCNAVIETCRAQIAAITIDIG